MMGAIFVSDGIPGLAQLICDYFLLEFLLYMKKETALYSGYMWLDSAT
jgi:hypothetical protein